MIIDTIGSFDVLSPKPRSILKEVEMAKCSRELTIQPFASNILTLNEFGANLQNFLKNSRWFEFRGASFSSSAATHLLSFLFFIAFPVIGIEMLFAKLSVW
jgi:hypothetical protein